MDTATIAAIATPAGYGGIGIIKVSGPAAIPAALSIFQREPPSSRASADAWTPESRRMYYGHIIDPETNRYIDSAMFVVMRGPASYTGEDVAEIQAHAGPLVLRSILELLLSRGVRLAGPGEFTRRAFLNGRMDLTQAEAVIDLIHARSATGLDLAVQHLDGHLRSEVELLRNALLDMLAELEASIDFPEDVPEGPAAQEIAERLDQQILAPIERLLRQYEDRSFLREGLRVVIAGTPNAGKSSLLNQLLDRERAIVTEYPGTTRDLVEDGFIIGGIPVVITDTAGIRDKPEPIEAAGIDKAYANIEAADLILFVLDSHQPIESVHHSFMTRFMHKHKLLVLNKIDLPERSVLPEEWKGYPTVRISAKYSQGIDRLKAFLASYAGDQQAPGVNEIVPNLRQKQAIEKSFAALSSARKGLLENQTIELIVIDLQEALAGLQEITGENVRPDILDRIFEQFCIGK
ncbi:MAG: tRNA uridine-5-carboxymethylaminomethyl(34) synthesis GTPase MnmE [Desulfobacterales bacterium]|nr:tRNA uridine-5-carboxymethylaminomethyl(34) synthesis GTPase MnmE [Desulfobacterales bacterium]